MWAFLDESGNILLKNAVRYDYRDYVIRAPRNAKYLIINDTSGSVSYRGIKPSIVNNNISECDRKVLSLNRIGQTYFENNNNFLYGNYHTAYDNICEANDNGKFEIDCSSFVSLVCNGTDYLRSKYVNGERNIRTTETGFNFYLDSALSAPYNTRFSYHLAEWAYSKGLAYETNNINDIQPGDIVFQSQDDNKNASKYKAVDHVAIALGTGPFDTIIMMEVINNNSKGLPPVSLQQWTTATLGSKIRSIVRIPLYDLPDYVSYRIPGCVNSQYETRLYLPLKIGSIAILEFDADVNDASGIAYLKFYDNKKPYVNGKAPEDENLCALHDYKKHYRIILRQQYGDNTQIRIYSAGTKRVTIKNARITYAI